MVLDTAPPRLEALAQATEDYVEDIFGERLDLVPVAPANVPHFLLDRYAIWRGALNDRSLAVLAIRAPRQGATAEYLKHRQLVQRQLGVDIVLLLLDQAPNAVRHQMVERKIGFIAPGAQIYVPEAFLDLRARAQGFAVPHADRISPTTQFLLMALLNGLDLEDRSLTGIADVLKVSIMSVSRSLDELEGLHLAGVRHVGRERRLHMLTGGRELWDTVRERLQSPVRKTRAVCGSIDDQVAPLAGESALARYTMLAPPRVQTRAVLSASWRRMEQDLALRSANPFDSDRMEVQTWTYDPQILAKDGIVDRLSLYLSVSEIRDERVAQAAEELLETFEW